jgi:hypothetical protein
VVSTLPSVSREVKSKTQSTDGESVAMRWRINSEGSTSDGRSVTADETAKVANDDDRRRPEFAKSGAKSAPARI